MKSEGKIDGEQSQVPTAMCSPVSRPEGNEENDDKRKAKKASRKTLSYDSEPQNKAKVVSAIECKCEMKVAEEHYNQYIQHPAPNDGEFPPLYEFPLIPTNGILAGQEQSEHMTINPQPCLPAEQDHDFEVENYLLEKPLELPAVPLSAVIVPENAEEAGIFIDFSGLISMNYNQA